MAQYHSELNAISAPVVDSDLVWVERSNAPYKATALQLKTYIQTGVDHGALAGLADDDHTQYSLVSGARAYTGKITLVASASGAASLNVPHGSAPSSPSDGDFWTTSAGGLFGRINGATYQFWADGNDGASSGLDSDLLDGQHGSYYRDAGNLNAGTVPDARFPATLPAASGVNLTALNGTNISSGTVADARLPTTMAGKTFSSQVIIDVGATDMVLRLEGTGNPYLALYDSGTRIGYLQADSATAIYLAADGNRSVNLYTNSVTRLTVTGDGYANYAAAGGTAYEIGWRDIPQNVQNANYTFVLADRGRGVGKDNGTAYTYTIPANGTTAFPVGSTITVFNHNATNNITIAITTDTLRLAGTTTTGSRTLAPWGFCTLYKASSTVWMAGGPGLT